MSEISYIEKYRHSLAHLLAAAVMEIWPATKNTIGPAVDNGFYYDFEFPEEIAFSEKEFSKIENKMKELLKGWDKFEHKEVSVDEARKHFASNPYKLELIEEIVERGEKITLYTSGTFTDLCRGGHLDNPKEEIDVNGLKLDRVAGAYWRGDEKNKMLTRIYGLAFETKEELEKYIWQQEEAKKRDHRILGKQLKLFMISDQVGSGLPMWFKNGNILRRELTNFLWDLHKSYDYEWVQTPHLAKEALYETSGHAGHYMEDMFSVWGGTSKEKFFLKPMSCPHHMEMFKSNQFSYRDMPVRYFEPAFVYRDEKTGQLSGLTRVRAITQDDGHIYCRVTEIENEAQIMINIIKKFYETVGMLSGYKVRLSLRDDDKTKWLGEESDWQKAQEALVNVCNKNELPYFEGPGEAAFYGPKLDFMFKDAIGRDHQLATIQCDFNAPKRFDLSFINESGDEERPVVIHRAISGSLERFLGIAIEHYAGNFPVWLAPTQIKIIPVRESHNEYAKKISDELKALDIRVDFDDADEGLGKKIRNGKNMKVPYMLVIGDKEIGSGELSLEIRDGAKQEKINLEELKKRIILEIRTRS